MARFLKWAAIILGGLILVAAAAFLLASVFRFDRMPVMARGFHEPFGYGGYRYMLFPFLLGRLLIPVAFFALLFVGGFVIGRAARKPRLQATASPVVSAVSSAAVCPQCGRAVQSDWNNCPYCGANLKVQEPPADQ